jgi:hypothetical protein
LFGDNQPLILQTSDRGLGTNGLTALTSLNRLVLLHQGSLCQKFPSVGKENEGALVSVGIPHSVETVDS